MSVQALAWVLDHSTSKGATRLVFVGIANHVDPRGEGWAYVAEILRAANCSEDSYKRAVAALVDAGELEVDYRAGGQARMRGGYRPNLYRIPALCGGQPAGDTNGSCGGQPAGVRGGQDAPHRGGQVAPLAIETRQRPVSDPSPGESRECSSSSSRTPIEDDDLIERRLALGGLWAAWARREHEQLVAAGVMPPVPLGRRRDGWMRRVAEDRRGQYAASARARLELDPDVGDDDLIDRLLELDGAARPDCAPVLGRGHPRDLAGEPVPDWEWLDDGTVKRSG